MTTRYKTQAFIFKKNNINDADRVFSVFTDNFGRLDVFAKAIRKNTSKLRSGIDIFSKSEIEFIQGRSRKTITDASVIERFNNIFQDLEKFKIANRIGEVLDNFIKGEEKDRDIFNLLDDTFAKLNNLKPKNQNQKLLYYYFVWNALSVLGYRPEVHKCNICHQKLNPYAIRFSYRLGGVICKKCFSHDIQSKKINSDFVKILRLIFEKEWQILSRLKFEPSSQKLLQEVSDNYYFYILSSHSFNNVIIK